MIEISSEKPKEVKLKGFAKFIGNLCEGAKKHPEYREFITGQKTRVLINNKDDIWAVIISINKNEVKVEPLLKNSKKDSKKQLSRNKYYWYGYWEIPNLGALMEARQWSAEKWIFKSIRGKTVVGPSQIEIVGKVLAMALPPPKKEGLKF